MSRVVFLAFLLFYHNWRFIYVTFSSSNSPVMLRFRLHIRCPPPPPPLPGRICVLNSVDVKLIFYEISHVVPCLMELEPNKCNSYYSSSCLDIQDLKASCLPLNHILLKTKVFNQREARSSTQTSRYNYWTEYYDIDKDILYSLS